MTTLLFALAACATAASPQTQTQTQTSVPEKTATLATPQTQTDTRIVFPASVSQGALVIGKVPPGSKVTYANRTLRVSGYGSVVFGVGRDEQGPLKVEIVHPDGGAESASIAVTPRDWPVENVNGVPPKN